MPWEMPWRVDDGNGVGIDGHRPLTPSENCQPAERLHPAANGRVYGAIGLADRTPLLVRQPQQLGMPRLPANADPGDAGQPLHSPVPQPDAARGVDKHHRVVHVLQQSVLKQRVDDPLGYRRGDRVQLPVGIDQIRLERPQPTMGHLPVNGRLVTPAKLGESLDQVGIELRAGTLEQLGHRPLLRLGRPVDVVRGHGVEGLDNGDHSCAQGNLPAVEQWSRNGFRVFAFVILSTAVVPSRNVLDDLEHLGRGATALQNLQAHPPRAAHQGRLVRVERRRLQQDAVRRADHADVVQQGGDFDRVALRFGQVHLQCPSRAGKRHPQGVSRHGRVLHCNAANRLAAMPKRICTS